MNINNEEVRWLLDPSNIPENKLESMYSFYKDSDILCMYNMVLQKAKFCHDRILDYTDEELREAFEKFSLTESAKANYEIGLSYDGTELFNRGFEKHNRLLKDLIELCSASTVFEGLSDDIKEKSCELIRTHMWPNDILNPNLSIEDVLFKSIMPIYVLKQEDCRIPITDSNTFIQLVRNYEGFIYKFFTSSAHCDRLDYAKNLNFDTALSRAKQDSSFPYERYLILYSYLFAKSLALELSFINDIYTIVDYVVDHIVDGEDSTVPMIPSAQKMVELVIEEQSMGLPVAVVSSEGIQGTNFNLTKKDAGAFQGAKADDITEKYKSRSLKLKKMFLQTFKIGPTLRKLNKNAKFFNKYFGRVPGLYKQYANEAYVYENRMKDDPAQVLSTKAVKFITDMAQFTDVTFGELVNMIQKIGSSSSSVQRIQLVKGYCKHYPIENMDDPKLIYNQIENETYYRIASAILKGIDIYGFTVEGIVQNKEFPSANHIVVSMFIDNPNETPEKQPVSQIFRKPESMLVFSKPENFKKFTNLYSATSSKILGDFDSKTLGNASETMKVSSDRLIQGVKNDSGTSFAEQSDPKLQKAIIKSIEKAVIHSIDLIADQKQRVLQCSAAAFQMVERISKTAQMCVVAMLEVERGKVDTTYSDSQKGSVSKAQQRAFDRNKRHVEGNEGRPQAKKYKASLFEF